MHILMNLCVLRASRYLHKLESYAYFAMPYFDEIYILMKCFVEILRIEDSNVNDEVSSHLRLFFRNTCSNCLKFNMNGEEMTQGP